MISALLFLAGGFILLVLGADRFVTGAAGTARSLGVRPLIIGMTIVGIATSAPEVLVGAVAAWDGKTAIAIGNAIGSNIANIGLVLGSTLVIMPIMVASTTLRREFLLMCVATLIPLALMLDHDLSRMDGMLLIVSLVIMTWSISRLALESPEADALAGEFEQELKTVTSVRSSLLLLFAGLILLLAGAEMLVHGAVTIARLYGVTDLVIGLTVIAIGTSLPELAASIMSVLKNEAEIAIGNIIGSNMFNMLMVLGIPVLIHPSDFGSEVLRRDFPVMIVLTLMMGWMVFIYKKKKLGRVQGTVLLSCFITYQFWLFHSISS